MESCLEWEIKSITSRVRSLNNCWLAIHWRRSSYWVLIAADRWRWTCIIAPINLTFGSDANKTKRAAINLWQRSEAASFGSQLCPSWAETAQEQAKIIPSFNLSPRCFGLVASNEFIGNGSRALRACRWVQLICLTWRRNRIFYS